MKCLCGCGRDVVSKGKKPRKYYSNACRMRYKRTLKTNKVKETNTTNEQKSKSGQETNIVTKGQTCGPTEFQMGLMRNCSTCGKLKYDAGIGFECPKGFLAIAAIIRFTKEYNPDSDCNLWEAN